MRETLQKMERWMKMEMLLMVAFSISGVIMGNVVLKMQGMIFALSTISIFMMMVKAGGLLLPIVKNVSTGHKYLALTVMGWIEIFVLFGYGYVSDEHWLTIYILFGIPYSLVLSAFFIDYDVILKDLTSTKMFVEIMYLERVMFSAMGILGGGITYFMSINMTVEEIIRAVAVVKVLASFIILYQYKTTYRGLSISAGDSSKQEESPIFLKKKLKDYRKGE